jgi:hypothetical protein
MRPLSVYAYQRTEIKAGNMAGFSSSIITSHKRRSLSAIRWIPRWRRLTHRKKIIVVDDASSDSSHGILEGYGDDSLNQRSRVHVAKCLM